MGINTQSFHQSIIAAFSHVDPGLGTVTVVMPALYVGTYRSIGRALRHIALVTIDREIEVITGLCYGSPHYTDGRKWALGHPYAQNLLRQVTNDEGLLRVIAETPVIDTTVTKSIPKINFDDAYKAFMAARHPGTDPDHEE